MSDSHHDPTEPMDGITPVPASPQPMLLGLDRGKTTSPAPGSKAPKGPTFGTRMLEFAQKAKRKAEIQEDKAQKKPKSASQLKQKVTSHA